MGRVIMLVLASLFLLASAACGGGGEAGQEGSPPPESDNGEEASPKTVASPSPEETTSSGGARGEIPVSGIVGEAVETDAFEFRVLDQFVTDRYYYKVNPFIETVVEGYSQAGQFLVVTYSATNTSPQAVEANLAASVEAKTEDGATETYQESEQISHPKGGIAALELAPRQMGTSQFIFDVPKDVKPERLTVRVEDATGTPTSGTVLDLTRQDPRGPSACSDEMVGKGLSSGA